jgi:hypothetical protein
MNHHLKAQFWWTRLKHRTARYIVECDTCQRVKADHMRLAGLLQPLKIPALHQLGFHCGSTSLCL